MSVNQLIKPITTERKNNLHIGGCDLVELAQKYGTPLYVIDEESIRQTFEIAPIYTFVAAVFIAPFLEEFVFRQGLRFCIKNNTLFIIVSGLIFGGLHVISNITGWADLLYLIPYSTPGFIFAYLLTKTDNVLVPASMHFMHNGILMSLQVLMMLLG